MNRQPPNIMQLPAIGDSPTPRAQLAEVRRSLAAFHRQGQPAKQVARAWSDAVERVVGRIFADACVRVDGAPDTALVAFGGLARRELCPFADVDLALVIKRANKTASSLADAFFYPLWDARVEVGHAVRTPAQFVELAREDVATRTTVLNWRFLAGDASVADSLRHAIERMKQSRPVRRLFQQDIVGWAAGGNEGTIYQLQPNLKSGPGGLRELHRVWWAGCMAGHCSWEALQAAGIIDGYGLRVLQEGYDTLLGYRQAMHFVAGRRQEQLRYELQDGVAEHLGIDTGPAGRTSADNLLNNFYRCAKGVRAVSTRALAACAEAMAPPSRRRRPRRRVIEGFVVQGQTLEVGSTEHFEREPLDILRVFQVIQRHRLILHPRTERLILEAAARIMDSSFAAHPHASRLLLDILSEPTDGGAVLLQMHELTVLERMVPGLTAVTGLVQRDMYHTYTVDAHLIACASLVLAMVSVSADDVPADIIEVVQRIPRVHVLVLAALLHDVGKGHGYGHSERGAAFVEQRIGPGLRLGHEDTVDVAFLVREHLTMFKISQRRDLDDPLLLQRFADSVESSERLDMLYVLSYADARTTGPEAWNDWKAALLRELFVRTRRLLRADAGRGKTLSEHAAARLAKVIAAAGDRVEQMANLAKRLAPRHLATHRTALVLRHLEAVERADERGACCTIAVDERRGGWEVVVVGPDRPGLLADLAGVLAAWGISIDAAYISGTRDGLAIDTFVVRPEAFTRVSTKARRAELAHELEGAVRGEVTYHARIFERQRARHGQRRAAPVLPPRIVDDPEAREDCTVLDVFAADRPALLFDVARAFFAAGVSVVLARITTEGERAVDAFYVEDAKFGGPLSEDLRRRVTMALTTALEKATPHGTREHRV